MQDEKEIVKYLQSLPDEERQKIVNNTVDKLSKVKFIPNPGPQTDAYYCKADILLYGGSGGSGKSALINGLALSSHKKSHIFRRRYADLGALTEDLLKLYGDRKGFVSAPRPKLRTSDNRLIEFGACQHLGDEEAWQGQPADLKAFDEVTQFLEQQVRYIIAWNRTTEPNQRCRVVFASNPPTSSDGDWIIPFFGPWLDPNHPNPAKSGEVRWFVTDPDGNDLEVEDDTPHQFPGQDKPVKPKSRTFIPGKLQDNPYLINTDYAATLDALPEPLRSSIRDGNFMLSRKDSANQVIPTQWVVEAQERWRPEPPPNTPQSAISSDLAQGGADDNVIGWRHDWWFSEQVVIPGKDTPVGSDVSGEIIKYRQDGAKIIIDVGGGYGGSVAKTFKQNEIKCYLFNSSGKTRKRSKDSNLKFFNKRAEAYWMFREALDPGQPGGSKIALPKCNKLKQDLTAPTFHLQASGIKIESKDDIRKRLGRSTDRADQVVMCWYKGERGTARASLYGSDEHGAPPWAHSKDPKVNMGYDRRRRRRNE